MKIRIIRVFSIGIMLMGLIHIIATFTPLIADKLAMLPDASKGAFTYFSLMCGALLILSGGIIYSLSGKTAEFAFVRKQCLFTLAFLDIDALLAVCYMPYNPCAWIIFALAIGLNIVLR